MTTDNTTDNPADLAADPEFAQLEKIQARLSFGYTATALGLFAAFVVAMIFWPEFLSQQISSDSEITLALAGALLLIILPLVIAALYLRAVERRLDPLRARLTERRKL